MVYNRCMETIRVLLVKINILSHRDNFIKYILSICVACFSILCQANYNKRHGWPTLKAPEQIIVCSLGETLEESMLLESLSGLAAKAVNENRFNEMVWSDVDNTNYERIFKQSISAMNIKSIKKMNVWELLNYLKDKGILNGYILYSSIKKKEYPITDYSSNVATVYASLFSGALIDISLEDKAKKYGLKLLKDARKESSEECFEKNRGNLNNTSALSIHPAISNLREYAIAHKLMLYADERILREKVLEWVRPLSPIIGWGCGDEYDATSVISEWGHYNTASDWCHNLTVISAAAPYITLNKVDEISLGEINFKDSTYIHSFVMSDGDNMQWTIGNFISNPNYFNNPSSSEAGINWTLCPINLSIISPCTWNELTKQHTHNSYIEYGGGYQYPDLFAKKRRNRKYLLRQFARRINVHLKDLNIKVFGAIFRDVDSREAQEALQIYAEELDGITGMIAIQYFPYELGKKVYWYKNKAGYDIPTITADFSLWNEVNPSRPRCGTPEYIAALINREVLSNKSSLNNYSVTIVHAWSNFENTSKITEIPAIGVSPILATKKLLLNSIRTVSLNELLWRVRMKYHPKQILSLMK